MGRVRNSGKAAARRLRWDKGMTRLKTQPMPSGGRTQQEIADACGVFQQNIDRIEKRALAKLRVALGDVDPELIKEALQTIREQKAA